MFKKIFLIIVLFLFYSITSNAQETSNFKNLKNLPKDISKDSLTTIMKGYTRALGVRCTFCHVGEEGKPLDTYDFPSDEKTSKLKARIMFQMTEDINSKYLSKLSEFSNHIEKVECVTCHRGAKEPKALDEIILMTIKREGVEKAIKTYHELYDRYFGGFTYDFRDHTLVSVIHGLIDEKNIDAAVAMGKLNLEMYPNSGVANFGMGQALEAKGDKENALASYKKALELMPERARFLNKKIEELQKK